MSEKVYIITKGDYSDYHIIGVYTSKQIAARIATFYGDDADVGEWDLDRPASEAYPEGHALWCVIIHDSGRLEAYPASVSTNLDRLNQPWRSQNNWHSRIDPARDTSPYWSVIVWARDKDHAGKVASDRIAQAKAEASGIA